jgi:hypothetical protein
MRVCIPEDNLNYVYANARQAGLVGGEWSTQF